MLYRNNLGLKERWGRFVAGALVIACSVTQVGFSPLGIALVVGGLMMAVTGLIGYCPACSMAGRTSIGASRDQT